MRTGMMMNVAGKCLDGEEDECVWMCMDACGYV
jgi:hypothetical protein